MQKRYQVFMAKTSKETEELWLPLWMHLKDTAGIIKKLVNQWIPGSVFSAVDLESELFLATAVFLAAVHDIGKATSYFQSIITKSCPSKYSDIVGEGFVINKEYRDAGKTPHAYAGQWILQSETTGLGIPESLAMVVGAHHGKPMGVSSPFGEKDIIKVYPVNFFGVGDSKEIDDLWENTWHNIVEQAIDISGMKSLSELPSLTLKAQVLLSGLLIIADWIASNTCYFPLIDLDDYGDDDMYPGRVNEAWQKVNFPDGWCSEIYTMDKKIFKERFGFLPNEVQNCMIESVNNCRNPGIFILEAQMGIGKTEAALGAAEVLASRKQASGIFFGLPTQATSNGLFERLYAWGKSVSEDTTNAIQLAHASAEFNDNYNQLVMTGKAYVDDNEQSQDGMKVHPWFQGSKRVLLADFVIGTVDQFLMASLRRKHFMLRHVGLAGKIVVIDECHAYDAYMNKYLERSIQWMAAYGVPVVLLSATLPEERRKALIECYIKAYSKYCLGERKPQILCERQNWKENKHYPLLTWTDGMNIGQREIVQTISDKIVKIKNVNSIIDMLRLLDERLQGGGCACIILNTVKYAQKVYAECKKIIKKAEIILYHAQFTMPDRFGKECNLLKRMGKTSKKMDRDRLILIGTQVLEQSLDYDADIMVTQLCPIDLLLQRIGRLHRHERNGDLQGYSRPEGLQKPECIILREAEESYDSGTKAIYGDYLLMRTEQILATEIKLPNDIPFLVQKVYNQNDDLGLTGERYRIASYEHEELLKGKKARADGYLLRAPSLKDNIDDILENPEESSEKLAEATVRDGVSSIEVLLMKRNVDGDILFVTEDHQEEILISSTQVPNNSEGRMIAKQRLRLPHIFNSDWNRKNVIQELENRNRRTLAEWQFSPWLQGELILLLNERNQTELCGYKLSYSFEKGLEYERKEDGDAGERI